MVADLTGMDMSNASLLDEASPLGLVCAYVETRTCIPTDVHDAARRARCRSIDPEWPSPDLTLPTPSKTWQATAAAEAMTMCFSLKNGKKKKFFVSQDAHPQNIGLIQTRGAPIGIEVRARVSSLVELRG